MCVCSAGRVLRQAEMGSRRCVMGVVVVNVNDIETPLRAECDSVTRGWASGMGQCGQ